jgi:hypothetical protein
MIDVEVSYRHQGRDHTVWCRSPTGSGYGRGTVQAERQVATIFPVGSTHPVYVNPDRDGEAFLVLPELHMLAVLVGFGVILVGLATALILPLATGIDQERATLGFMLLLGVVLFSNQGREQTADAQSEPGRADHAVAANLPSR